MKDPTTPKAMFVYGLKLGLCIAWGAPLIGLAIFMAISVVGIPVAIALVPIAAAPWLRLMKNHDRQVAAWQLRDQPLNEGTGDVPWEM